MHTTNTNTAVVSSIGWCTCGFVWFRCHCRFSSGSSSLSRWRFNSFYMVTIVQTDKWSMSRVTRDATRTHIGTNIDSQAATHGWGRERCPFKMNESIKYVTSLGDVTVQRVSTQSCTRGHLRFASVCPFLSPSPSHAITSLSLALCVWPFFSIWTLRLHVNYLLLIPMYCHCVNEANSNEESLNL